LTNAQIASRHATYQGTAAVDDRFSEGSGLPARVLWQDVSTIKLKGCEQYNVAVAN